MKCGQVDARPPPPHPPHFNFSEKVLLPPSVRFRSSWPFRVRRRPFLALLLPFCRDDVGISPVVVVEMPLVRFDQSGHFVFEVGVAPPFLSVSFFGHEGILFALRRHRCARFPRSLAWVGIPGVRERERGKGRAFQRSLSPHEHSARSFVTPRRG